MLRGAVDGVQNVLLLGHVGLERYALFFESRSTLPDGAKPGLFVVGALGLVDVLDLAGEFQLDSPVLNRGLALFVGRADQPRLKRCNVAGLLSGAQGFICRVGLRQIFPAHAVVVLRQLLLRLGGLLCNGRLRLQPLLVGQDGALQYGQLFNAVLDLCLVGLAQLELAAEQFLVNLELQALAFRELVAASKLQPLGVDAGADAGHQACVGGLLCFGGCCATRARLLLRSLDLLVQTRDAPAQFDGGGAVAFVLAFQLFQRGAGHRGFVAQLLQRGSLGLDALGGVQRGF